MFDWLIQNSWVLWLALFLILAIVEMVSLDLFFIMMSLGALAALAAALAGTPFWLQVVLFALVALAMMVLVRPIALRHLRKGPREQRTNVERLLGETAVVLEPTSALSGLVKIGGDTWTARTSDGGTVGPGARVSVIRIEGATAVVSPLSRDEGAGPLPAQ